MKRNRLYTVNKWNKPAFMPEKNLFAFGDFLKEDNKNYIGNWLGAKDIKAPVGGLIGAAGTAVGSLANNLISNGFTSGAGNGIANIGGAVGSAVSNVNPVLGGIISAGTGAIGGGVNALWGMKTDKEALERANSSISALNNFTSNAESFDDIRSPQAVAGIGDVYKGGVFKKGDARKKNEELRKNLANAMAFAENSVENNIYNISQNQLNDALSNYAAYGGPLGFGEGALGLMQQNRYFDTIDKRTEAISKNNNYSMPTAYTGARTFDDGGLMPFLEGFGSDPIGAAVRYNRDAEQRRAAQEAAKEQAAREAEYSAMQQRLANLETRNNGLEAMLSADAFTPMPSTLPIEASITPSEAAPTVASTPRRAGKGTRLSGNQWAQEHLNRWHDFLLKKGVNDADATRLSSFFTAQDGLESAGGTSSAAREKNNFGGMQKNGKNITYASPEDYMEDKWKMMNNRFKSALSAQDIDEYATILGNPNYGGKGYLYYVNDKVKLDPNNPEWIKAQTQHMNNYINGMRAWSKKAFGGELGTNGTDFTNGLLEINAGGSHQSNPLEGVPLGVDAEGIPNLVEEGETVYNDYVFSDRMKVPGFMYKELGLGGVALKKQHNKQSISFADASKKLAQESEQRPNDPISKAGLDAALSRLAEVQETERMRKQTEEYMGLQQYACGGKMKKYAHGGKKGNLYDGIGERTQEIINGLKYNNFEPSTRQAENLMRYYDPAVFVEARNLWHNIWPWQDLGNGFGNAANTATANTTADGTMVDTPLMLKDYAATQGSAGNSGSTGSTGMYSGQTRSSGTGYSGTSRRGANQAATTDFSKLERFDPIPVFSPTDERLNAELSNVRIVEPSAETGGSTSGNGYVTGERIPTYDTWMRYIPAVGSGIMALTDALGITNKPDYTYANKLEAAANAAGYAPNIQYEPIGNYLRYTPLDRQYYINQLMANSRATDRALSNTSAPSRAASMLANGYNTTLSLGNLARQAEEYNLAQREKVEDFNRKTNMFNSQMGLEAAMANARYRQQASQMGLSGLAQAAALRDSIDQRVGASRSANITNFLNNIGNIGRENMAFNMVNATNVANNGYWIDRKGRIHYVRRPKD